MKVDRRGGGRISRVGSCLIGMAVVLAVTATLGVASTSTASAARGGREKLPGHQGLVPPGATLVGPAPTSTALPLTVTLKPRDPAALTAEVQQVSDPKSPDYRHFLTPSQFAREFGPTSATIAQVTSSLRQEGLTVGAPSATGLSVPVSGNVGQVQSAFSTPISKYRLSSGKTGYDNATAPEVDTSVAPQIEGILGLDTLSPPQPSTTVPEASHAVAHPTADLAAPTPAAGQPQPVSGNCSTGIAGVHEDTGALDAPDLAQAYSFTSLYSSNAYGAGSTIALVEMSGAGYSMSDINYFANCYGITLGPNQITKVAVDGGTGTGAGTAEAELDIETALSLAPKANMDVYEGGASARLYDVFKRIVDDDTAKIVSASWTNGCEAYLEQGTQTSENALFEAAATEGQSVFVATGDQGSEGCNVNGVTSASTGSDPVAQAVDPATGTLYIANKVSNTISVDSEGSAGDALDAGPSASVASGTGPDAVALDASAGRVFVANSGGTLTVFPTSTCNRSTTSGCSSPTQIASGGHLSAPTALAVNGSTLYVANHNGSVAVYSVTAAETPTWEATVILPSGSVPTALAVDATSNGSVYVADGAKNRVEYFSAATCNATNVTGCSTAPAAVTVGTDPVALAVANGPGQGDLYVANAEGQGGITVIRLSNQTLLTTISTSQANNGTGVVESIGMSPDGTEVLAVLSGLEFPPDDVMATIDTTTNTITSTVNLETGTDSLGQLVSDGALGYVWVTDETSNSDVIQNLNPAVSDPASQPYVTAVGGTSFGHGAPALVPPPTEQAWNDALYYSEGAGGGGISESWPMPTYQQPLGTVSGSSGTPCNNPDGECREIPDVSADADPSTGYIVYDDQQPLQGWTALGGTSGATPLWAAVLAVVASGDANTAGYGALNPALYELAQQSPGTYLNDVTSGNNDYNAMDGGQYPALTGYDMATGLGTPVASELASGLTAIPLDVVVSGSQTYGSQTPTITASPDYAGSGTTPYGVTLNTNGATCTQVDGSTPIGPTLPAGSDTLVTSSCGGATLSGTNEADYVIVYTRAPGDFTVNPAPLTVTASSGSMNYGGTSPTVTPTYSGFVNNETPSSLTTQPTCSTTATSASSVSGNPYSTSCDGAVDSNYAFGYVEGSVTVTPAALTITAASPTMALGGPVPTVVPIYSGFVNGDTTSSLNTQASCTTTATGSSPASPPTYPSSCSGASDSNYSFNYVPGAVTITSDPVYVSVSGAQTYGGDATFSGTDDDPPSGTSVDTTGLTCSDVTPVTALAPTLPSGSDSLVAPSCSGAILSGSDAAGAAIVYTSAQNDFTVSPATLTITASNGIMAYGSSPPTITPSYTGLVNGDSQSSLSAPPVCSTTATSASAVSGSPYASACSGAVDANYTINYAPGAVTVSPATLTITASNGTMAYGSSPPTITPSYSGFENGDGASSLGGQLTCSTTATSASAVSGSPYASACGGAVDANYTINYAPGAVTVSPATLTITASNGTMAYGSSPPTITPSYSGFENGDGASSLGGQLTCSTTATSASAVSGSPYASACGGAVDANYTINYAPGIVTVSPATLTITASNGTMAYGSSPPTITPSYAGFVNGDNQSSLTARPMCTTTATSASSPSPPTYRSSCSGAADPNYAIGYAPGAVTVSDPPPTPTPAPPVPVAAPTNGYWLVGSDGGIFTFGSAQFYGSTGSIQLQRPVVGISPTADKGGYWLVASDGGIFAFGDAGYYGSIPGDGLSPAGSGLPHSLNAPIVAMVPSSDGGGYFMVASDGGVFAFGDAYFAGSCPGIGGCSGAAVGVVPDASGNGYWLVTQTGNIYAFGDAPFYGAPGNQGSPVTSAVRTANGGGYWVLLADGAVYAYGNAVSQGGPVGSVGGLDPASAIFSDGAGGGYWVASADGDVFAYGGAPNDGSMAGNHLNGSIIAATGF
jgi:subtilase family serine protease